MNIPFMILLSIALGAFMNNKDYRVREKAARDLDNLPAAITGHAIYAYRRVGPPEVSHRANQIIQSWPERYFQQELSNIEKLIDDAIYGDYGRRPWIRLHRLEMMHPDSTGLRFQYGLKLADRLRKHFNGRFLTIYDNDPKINYVYCFHISGEPSLARLIWAVRVHGVVSNDMINWNYDMWKDWND